MDELRRLYKRARNENQTKTYTRPLYLLLRSVPMHHAYQARHTDLRLNTEVRFFTSATTSSAAVA